MRKNIHVIMQNDVVHLKDLSRKSQNISCGCSWVVRLKWMYRNKTKQHISLMISFLFGFHSNIYYHTFVKQLIIDQKRSSGHIKHTYTL